MNYMLDTNILIYLIKNRPVSVAARMNSLAPTDGLCMSFVTYAELLKGAERSQRKPEVLQQLAALRRQIPVLFDADDALCAHHAHHAGIHTHAIQTLQTYKSTHYCYNCEVLLFV